MRDMNRNYGTVIAPEKTKDFFNKMNKTCRSPKYWEECRSLLKNVNPEAIAEMNRLIDKEK